MDLVTLVHTTHDAVGGKLKYEYLSSRLFCLFFSQFFYIFLVEDPWDLMPVVCVAVVTKGDWERGVPGARGWPLGQAVSAV